jgi:hypothetical protein
MKMPQVVATAKAVLVMIDKQAEIRRVESVSIRDLRIAVDMLKNDCNMYELLLRTMIADGDQNLALKKMCNR